MTSPEAKSSKNRELQFSAETPPDSGIRANNAFVYSRRLDTSSEYFLILGIRVVKIVAAQSLQLGMV